MKDEEIIVQEQQDDMSLPENAARELKPGEKYVPILKPDKTYPEITPYSVSLGLIMAVIFSRECHHPVDWCRIGHYRGWCYLHPACPLHPPG